MPQNAYDIAPWLGEHEAPMVALARGVQAGSQLTTNFLQGMRARQEKEDFEMMAPLKYQEAENQVKIQALNIATQQNMLNMKVNATAGQAFMSEAMANVMQQNYSPESMADFARKASQYPETVGSPAWQTIMTNAEKSSIANQKAKQYQLEAEDRDRKIALLEERVGIAKERADAIKERADAEPTSIRIAREIDTETQLAIAAEKSGDTATAARHRGIANNLTQSLPGPMAKPEGVLSARDRVEYINAKNKTLELMQGAGKNSVLYKLYQSQIYAIDQALEGGGGSADPDNPAGLRR